MMYNEDNPHKTNEKLLDPVAISEEEADQMQSSDDSYEASDVSVSDEDFSD